MLKLFRTKGKYRKRLVNENKARSRTGQWLSLYLINATAQMHIVLARPARKTGWKHRRHIQLHYCESERDLVEKMTVFSLSSGCKAGCIFSAMLVGRLFLTASFSKSIRMPIGSNRWTVAAVSGDLVSTLISKFTSGSNDRLMVKRSIWSAINFPESSSSSPDMVGTSSRSTRRVSALPMTVSAFLK